MKNPLEHGGVVSGDVICNRAGEIKDPLRAMENAERMSFSRCSSVEMMALNASCAA